MMTILHLIPTLEGGGAERQLAMLGAEQSRRGWCVHLGVRRAGQHSKLLSSSGVAIHFLGDLRGPNPRLLFRIKALIEEIKPDVVQTWLPQMDFIGGIAALWKSIPWIVSERSSAHRFLGLTNWARHFLTRFAGAVVANSLGGVAHWRSKLPKGSSIFQVANAVDVAKIRYTVSVLGACSDSDDGSKEILVVGRLIHTKAVEIVIQAISHLPASQAIHVSVIGEGPLRGELEAKIKMMALQGRVALLPYISDWWRLLKNSSALVSMSRREGQPNVVLEAMAAGCPLIVSDIPAHREVLDEDSAILVPPDDPPALAKAIASLLADPISAQQRAQRASAYVDGLTIQSAANAYELVYQSVIGRKNR